MAFQIDSEIKCIILYYVESLNNSFIRNPIKELYMKIYIFQEKYSICMENYFIAKVCIETNVYGEGRNKLRASTSKKIILHPM